MDERTPNDQQAVANLLADYALLLDTEDFAGTAALWADDGVMAVFGREFVGPGPIAEFLAGAPLGKHLPGAASVRVDGDTATARSGFAFWKAPELTLYTVGRYEDELVRTAAGWRFARRSIVIEHRA